MASDSIAFEVQSDKDTGQVASVRLYGEDLLDAKLPCVSELWVNGLPVTMRPHSDPNARGQQVTHLKGERFIGQLAGWGLVLARRMGPRLGTKHPCYGIHTLIRRELADQTCPPSGPGGPVIEVPLYVDAFSILNWNWKFWGDETRMIFPSIHSGGPDDEFGHVGYEHDTPESAKRFMQNIRRRIYPGTMLIHGGLFYNASSEHWLAITCRRPQVGYHLNINDAGRGVGYDFTLHAPFDLGDSLQLPEIKLYYGSTRDERMRWLGEYATFYYEEPPQWVHKTVWQHGLAWNNKPTWTEQADFWEAELDKEEYNGISYCLVTNRPLKSGTTPLGYEPDPNHGTQTEFKAMCHRMADRGVPLLVWMSHSGLLYQGGDAIDDDWFIRGIDGRVCASWGSIDGFGLTHINPGHPGYIEYTKRWIRFYIGECRCKGIFFDCLGWAFPPDFTPRDFMRYPGDTNRMAVRFMDEVYAQIKQCDPEAIVLGEGATFEAPVNVVSIHSNPKRAIDGLGPRDFVLQLNRWSPKQIVVDQGPRLFPACGMTGASHGADAAELNRYMCKLLSEHGGPGAFDHIPGDLSVQGDLLVVPCEQHQASIEVRLAPYIEGVETLRCQITERLFHVQADGAFKDVPSGVYRMGR
ncbi:MAG: hypothetical protein WD042_17465 [Phycisphaeraceae bacterium]